MTKKQDDAPVAATPRELALANLGMAVSDREAVGTRASMLDEREEILRLREQTIIARLTAARAVQDRDVVMEQMRAANEALVLATMRADDAAAEAIAARATAADTDTQFQTALKALRHPLAPILTALEVIENRDATAFPREREIIGRQVKHLVRLVDDLLDISRITRGIIELNRQRVELAEIVAGAVEIVAPFLEEKQHRLEIDVAHVGLAVDVDVIRMTQVVGNLLTNAAKYTPACGSIALSGERSGPDVLLRVRDNGIGISAEMLTRIFDPFTQEARALDGGLGLGLPIAANIVGMHGGTVTARSEGVDLGSELTLVLPFAPEVRS